MGIDRAAGRLPGRDHLEVRRPPDAQVNAVKQNKADHTQVFADVASALQRDGYGSQLHINPGFTTEFFFLNTRLAPFDNVKVRRAVNFAVDRDRLVELEGGPDVGQLSCQVLPPNFAGYVRYCPYTLDLARARQLVAASGTVGQKVTVWTPQFRRRASAYVVSVLQSLGYKARLKVVGGPPPLGVGKYFATVADSPGKIQAGFSGWVADYPSASAFFSPLLTCTSYQPGKSDNVNFSAFCYPSIDREIARARALQSSDPQAAVVLWSKIDHDVVDQAPWIAYANGRAVDFVSRRVGNYQFNPQWGVLLDQLWVR